MPRAAAKIPPKPKAKRQGTGTRAPADRTSTPKLTDDIRAYVVTRLACYDTPSTITRDVNEMFGVDVSLQAIVHYSPLGPRADSLAQKWKDLFFSTREAYLATIAAEPISQKIHRLRRLSKLHDSLFDAAMSETDHAKKIELSTEARAALEQAAKEVGDVFTNTTKQTGAVDHRHVVAHVSLDEKRNMLVEKLAPAMKQLPVAKEE